MITNKSMTDEDLTKACELYVRDRYAKLSEDAKSLVHDTTMYDYTRLRWERDYYRRELISRLQREPTT